MRRIDILSSIFAILTILCLIGCFVANNFHLTIIVWILAILGTLMAIVVVLDALDRAYISLYTFLQNMSNQSHRNPY